MTGTVGDIFELSTIEPLSNVLIHGPKQSGKSTILKNIFHYITGCHSAVRQSSTNCNVLFVASERRTAQEYSQLATNVSEMINGNLIVVSSHDYSQVLKYAEVHKESAANCNCNRNHNHKLLIVMDDFNFYYENNVGVVKKLLDYGIFGVSVVISSSGVHGYLTDDIKKSFSFDYVFSTCDHFLTATVKHRSQKETKLFRPSPTVKAFNYALHYPIQPIQPSQPIVIDEFDKLAIKPHEVAYLKLHKPLDEIMHFRDLRGTPAQSAYLLRLLVDTLSSFPLSEAVGGKSISKYHLF